VGFFAKWFKKLLVVVLVDQNKEKNSVLLIRKITFLENSILIKDQLKGRAGKVTYLDKFSTIHMGSSRYGHLDELQFGMGNEPGTKMEFDSQGVLKQGKVEIK